MRSRLLTSTVAVALVAVVVLGVPLAYVLARLTRLQVISQLEGRARTIGNELLREQRGGEEFTNDELAALLEVEQRADVVDRQGRQFSAGPQIAGPVAESRRFTRGGASVVVAVSEETISDRQERAVLPITLLGLAALAVAVVLALVVARRLTAPFADLARVSDELGAGNFAARASPSGVAEADQVAAALNRSAARIEELVRREREFSSNASHQLRTPLAALSLRLEKLLLAHDLDAAGREEVYTALSQVDRLTDTVQELLALARSGRAGGTEQVDVGEVVADNARQWQDGFERVDRELTVGGSGGAIALATTGALRQALDVLLENSLRHGDGRTRVAVGARGGYVVISVSDEGPGIPRELVPRIFERHASDGTGSGIGLALARSLVESGGGRLELASAKPAQFDLYLPRPDGNHAGLSPSDHPGVVERQL